MKPSRDEMESVLKNAGWSALWHPDNWVPPGATNPDWAGMPIEVAYRHVLSEKDKVGAVDQYVEKLKKVHWANKTIKVAHQYVEKKP